MKLLRVPEHVISHTLRGLQHSWDINGHYHRSQGLADEVLAFGLVEGGYLLCTFQKNLYTSHEGVRSHTAEKYMSIKRAKYSPR